MTTRAQTSEVGARLWFFGASLLAVGGAACGDRSVSMCGGDAGVGDTGAPAAPAPFAVAVMAGVGIGSEGGTSWENTGAATRSFAWGTGPFANVRLVVDLATECFPFEDWAALHPPPAGQAFPARCDAFDRNLDVFVVEGDPPVAQASADPAAAAGLIGSGPAFGRTFEVIHAITPFGGPARFEADLTDLANAVPDARRLRVELASFSDPAGRVTGSDAGWTVSATLTVTPGRAPRRVLAAQPLFAVRLGAGESPVATGFEVPSGAAGGRIEYRASGHGQGARSFGCNGPAEEFCARRHVVSVDGVEIASFEPRRTDCESLCTLGHFGPPVGGGFDYCVENPCGAIASVRAPRANWCPGSQTPPQVWDSLPAFLEPGSHSVSVDVVGITPGGSWLLSAIYYGYGTLPP